MPERLAKDCKEMTEVRAQIDRIDARLVELIAERFTYVDRAWQLKNSPADATVPWRIEQVIEKVRTHAETKGIPARLVEALWRQMIGWFIQYEQERLQAQTDQSAGTDNTKDQQG